MVIHFKFKSVFNVQLWVVIAHTYHIGGYSSLESTLEERRWDIN